MIQIENLSKEFLGKETLKVLTNINLQIADGDFVAIIGPSGCGKTTLLNIIGELDYSTSGNINFNKSDPTFGFIFQTPSLLEWRTVEENIRLPLEIKQINKNIKRRKAISKTC